MVWLKNSFFQAGPAAFLTNFDTYYQVNNLPDHALFALSILEQQERWQMALDLVDRLDEPVQALPAMQLTRAIALIELQQGEAVTEILESLDESEVDANAGRWYVQGRLQESKGDLVQAASYLTAYHKASPGLTSVTHLADVLLQAGRTADVLALTQRYIEAHPLDDTARLSLALKLAPQHPAAALEMLQNERADWLVRRSWELSNNVAWLYLQQGEPATALTYSRNALALNAEDATVRRVHASALQALGRQSDVPLVLKRASKSKQ
jgi:tetratricopeptide (TPR) repeat protein